MKAWDDIPEDERPFQRRLMEVAAGFAEHCDVQVGRIVDELDRLGYGENTLFLYIWGDNGSSAEGQDGTIAELLAQNGIPTTPRMHIDALEQLGGLDVLGSPKTDNQYHSGWGWAGSTPYKGVKLLASHLGGTRNPLAIRWPKKVAPDPVPRDHFLHVNDVVPTIYDIVGIEPPLLVNGVPQIPIAGASFARTLTDPSAPGGKKTQYFEVMGSRAHLSRRLDGLDVRSTGALAAGIATRHPRLDTRQRPLGALSPRRRLVTGPRPRRRDARQARPDARTVRHRSRPQLGAPHRRRFVGADLSPRTAHHTAVPRLGFPRRQSPASPSSARPRWATRTTPSPSKPTCPPTPTEFCTRSAVSPVGSPATSTTDTCATSTTVSSFPAPRSAPTPNCRPAPPRLS